MKKSLYYLLILGLIISGFALISGCGSPTSGGSDGGGGGASMVTLTGHVTGAAVTVSLFTPPISKVVIFNCYGGFWIADIHGGRFTGEAEAGRPIGLIFSDSDLAFRGYLTMGSGIDSIPLNLVDSASREINLNDLILSGSVATTERDLIDEASLSTSEVAAMSFGNELFSNVIKHPDADHNDIIDILETPSKYFRPFTMYFVRGGSLDAFGVPTASYDMTEHRFNLDVLDLGGSMPSPITVTYPDSGAHSAAYDPTFSFNTSTRRIYFTDTITPVPVDGTYLVTYRATDDLSFEVSGQDAATQYIALAVPTVSIEAGVVKKINWVYKIAGGTGEAIAPESLIHDLIVQINSSTVRIYDSPNLSPSVTEHVLTSNISWSNVNQILMAYNDVFGNHIVAKWQK